jgi:amino acid transporter
MTEETERSKPAALAMLSASRPRNLGWVGAAGLLFGDWGTSRLYVLGLAFLVGGRSSLVLILFMSLLVLAVGWAYTHICRIYPEGGGVYTAGRQRARVLGVIGALLLFADYTITASLSAVEAFHYFGLGQHSTAQVEYADPGRDLVRQTASASSSPEAREPLVQLNSPGLWAIVSILVLGLFNLLGPKHTAAYAVFAAIGMSAITLLLTIAAIPQMKWSNIDWTGIWWHPPGTLWISLTYVVLALSGVEAIANLTGVMKKPVFVTARKSIWLVALEVAVFNMILCLAMISLLPAREAHTEDMLAYMAGEFLGAWGEWPVRILGGLLLLSAANTAVGALTSIIYVMSRDGELPEVFQKLNRFGSPWVAALVAGVVPASVLLFAHDLKTLASLYAIGVVGAVAINCLLCATHPRLPQGWRNIAMAALGLLLTALWITLAGTKLYALAFVLAVLGGGLLLRHATLTYRARHGDKPSLLRKAILEQLTPEALAAPKLLIGTYGSTDLALPALHEAKRSGSVLVVCFIREVQLSYKIDPAKLTLDTDPAAVRVFAKFLDLAHEEGVNVLPVYDTGPDAAVLIAENAAINGCSAVLIGSSRQGALYRLIKGKFQQRLESLLPPEIPVRVLTPELLRTPEPPRASDPQTPGISAP